MSIERIYTEDLVEAVNNSFSFKELLDNLGYSKNSGSMYNLLKTRLLDEGIDYSHFYISEANTHRYSLSEILVLNPECNVVNQRLIKRLVKEKLLEYKCSCCGNNGVWNNKPLVLQLEHRNGNNKDYRLSNLCLLCPNCHSQTSTYCGKNYGAYNKPYYVDKIIDLLKNTDISMENIAFKFGVTRSVVSSINNGHTYKNPALNYPIRKIDTTFNYCDNCGIKISKTAHLCNKCEGLSRRNNNTLPLTREELKLKLRTLSFVKIGKEYNVSDNAVRKWCDRYNLPRSSSIIKAYTDEEWDNL